MSINFDNFTLTELLELEQALIQESFDTILTEKIKEGKIVFSGTDSGLLN